MPQGLLGGLLMGVGKGRADKLEREREKDKDALTKQLMNLKIKALDAETKERDFYRNLIQQEIDRRKQQETQTESTPTSSGADKSPLIQSLAEDPIMAAVMKKVSDIDFLGAGRMSEQKRHNQVLESSADRNYKLRLDQFNREGNQYISEDATGPGGVVTKQFRPKFGPPPSLTMTAKTKPSKGSESAGKVATVKAALQNFPYLKKSYIGEGGKVNRDIVLKSNAPFGGIGEGRKVRAQYLEALDAKIRAMTGAAINEQEIPYYDQQFYPSVLDNDATIKDKLFRMERFLDGYLEEMAPGENVDPKNMVTTLEGKRFKIKEIKTIKNRQEYDELPMGTVYKWNGIEYTKGK